MDQGRFDSLTRSLATAKTRRGFLGTLAALGTGLLGARSVGAQVTQAQCGNKVCAANPAVCTNGCVCCTYANGNNRCVPPNSCSGTVVTPTTTTTTTTTTSTTTTTAAPTTTTTAAPTTTTTAAPTNPYGVNACETPTFACSGSSPTCNGNQFCGEMPATNGFCACASHTVSSIYSHFGCSTDADCAQVATCLDVACFGDPRISCSSDADCASLTSCTDGACGGQVCFTDADCAALGFDVCISGAGLPCSAGGGNICFNLCPTG